MIFTPNFRFSNLMIISLLTLFYGRDVRGKCVKNMNEVENKFNSAFEDMKTVLKPNLNIRRLKNLPPEIKSHLETWFKTDDLSNVPKRQKREIIKNFINDKNTEIVKQYIENPLIDIISHDGHEATSKLCMHASTICFNEDSNLGSEKLFYLTLIIDNEMNKLERTPMMKCYNSMRYFYVSVLYENQIPFLFIFENNNETDDAKEVKFYAYIEIISDQN